MSRYGRTRVCVYAVRSEEEALAAAEAGADAVGFMFNRKSGRFIEPEEAWEIASLLPPLVATVGVFENASVERFMEIEEIFPTDYTQLHGEESEDVVRQCGPRVIKTVRYAAGGVGAELERWDALDEVDAVLVTFAPGEIERAGALDEVGAVSGRIVKPVLIGGGVTAANVGRVIQAAAPWAVVVSSSVEDQQGSKSPELMGALIAAVRRADAAAGA